MKILYTSLFFLITRTITPFISSQTLHASLKPITHLFTITDPFLAYHKIIATEKHPLHVSFFSLLTTKVSSLLTVKKKKLDKVPAVVQSSYSFTTWCFSTQVYVAGQYWSTAWHLTQVWCGTRRILCWCGGWAHSEHFWINTLGRRFGHNACSGAEEKKENIL